MAGASLTLRLRLHNGPHRRRRLQRDHWRSRCAHSGAELPVEDKEHLRHCAAVHELQASPPVHGLACGLEGADKEVVEPVDKGAVLGRDHLAIQGTRLERLTVDPVDVRRHRLPPSDQRIGSPTLLGEDGQIVAERVVAPGREPEEVAAGRVATECANAVVLRRAHLPPTALHLDHKALEVEAKAGVEFRKPPANGAPTGELQTRRRGRHVARRPRHRAIRRNSTGVREDGTGRADATDDPVLRVLEHVGVGPRAIQAAVITEGSPEHLRKGLVLAEVAAASVQDTARVNTPLAGVLVPEDTDERAVQEGLHAILGGAGGIKEVGCLRQNLAIRALPGRDRDRPVRQSVPDDRAEGADDVVVHVGHALDVPDQRIGRVRQGIVLHAKPQTLTRQMRLQIRP